MERSRADYTVGWICALPIEVTAAVGMLDEEHQPIAQLANDSNNYTLGRIGLHNIVVACLPSNTTGIGPAAAVVAQMLIAFPNLKFSLMVGVGGGVSNIEHDIRLGDVVISEPSNMHPGVIQYDSGKMLQNNEFQRTGSLNRPPPALLSAISALKARHIQEPPALLSDVTAFIARYPYLEEKAKHQGKEEDLLFDAEYTHQNQNDSRDQPGSICSACDRNRLVIRKQRYTNEPVLHYGLIASGNMVIRDGSQRDKLAEELVSYASKWKQLA